MTNPSPHPLTLFLQSLHDKKWVVLEIQENNQPHPKTEKPPKSEVKSKKSVVQVAEPGK